MYGNWAEIWAGVTGQPVETTAAMGSHYLCPTCEVHGVVRDETPRCWCCGSEDLMHHKAPSFCNAALSPEYEEVAA